MTDEHPVKRTANERPQVRRLLCFASALNGWRPCEKALLVIRSHMTLRQKTTRERQPAVIVVIHDECLVGGFDAIGSVKGGGLS